ncbi:pseudouridine synthase [Paracoccus tegillarcae]|uniref:Pseudouridine synthase n=1 Tax=Paracoccus tegillarcae TaxID=1529068 RepID=A0A2K9EQA9_9RHOB|nr:pseudouridine synthase [Paracoccus tegillarcae]AUH33855.1 RNA pseudouridine synthase [Paracoccus tegillarcae]
MTDAPNPDKPTEADRIAKVIARAGLASRREAERMIVEGRVSVNGEKIASPALDVLPTDKVEVDGKALEAPQETRLWIYYKPVGLVTSDSDEKGRQTVFDALPRDLPRVMSIGRLDLNSEGLLLLTNDGELKRRLELPATGWLRRYRVRVNGKPTDLTFDPLRRGITIDDEDFQPMEVRLDSQQGANAWLTVGIREGRNREIRRAMTHIGLQVNRLIRIGYGPFKLTGLEENEVREIKRRTLRDQLGGLLTGETEDKPRDFRERGADQDRPRRRDDDDRRPRRDDGPRKPRFDKGDGADRKPYARRDDDGAGRPQRDRGDGPRKPRFDKGDGGAKPFRSRDDGPRKPRFDKGDSADRKPYARRDEDGAGRPQRDRGDGPRKPRFDKGDSADRRPYARRDGEGEARRDGAKPYGNRDGGKPYGSRDGGKPSGSRDGGKTYGNREVGKSNGSRDGAKPGPRRDGGKPGGFAGRDDAKKSYGPRKDSRPGHQGKPGQSRGPRPGGGKPRSPRG